MHMDFSRVLMLVDLHRETKNLTPLYLGLGFLVFLIVLIIVVGTVRTNIYVSQGKIIKRKMFFYKMKYNYVARIEDKAAFFAALTDAVKATGVVSYMEGDYETQMNYSGKRWQASLIRTDDGEIEKVVSFSFQLTQYSQSRYAGPNVYHLNMLLTAIEKTFLAFCPNTRITSEAITWKGSSKFF